MIDIIDARL